MNREKRKYVKNALPPRPDYTDPQVHTKAMTRRLEIIKRRYRSKAGRLKGAAREIEMQRSMSRVFGPPEPGSDEEKACELLRAFIQENQEEA